MWPRIRDEELLEESDLDENAIGILSDATSTGPSIVEKQAARYVLRRAEDGYINEDEAFESLCQAAIAWKDASLWNAAFDYLGSEVTLEDFVRDQLGEAIRCLGASVVLERWVWILGWFDVDTDFDSRLETLIDGDIGSIELLDLLADLQLQTAEQGIPEVQQFIEESRRQALEDLDVLSQSEVPLLVSALSKQGGIVFFEES